MAVELITGHAAAPHVSSDDAGAFNKAVFGSGSYILDGCAVTIESANSASIAPGNMLLEGRHVRISNPHTVAGIQNGASGYKRVDTIAAHYHKEPSGVESIEFKVVKGTPTQGEPVAPKMPGSTTGIGTLNDVYIPVANIRLDNLTPSVEGVLFQKWAQQMIRPIAVEQINAPAVEAYKIGNLVFLRFGANGNKIATWGSLTLAKGLPRPVSNTAGTAYSQGDGNGEHLLLIEVSSDGVVSLKAKGYGTPAGWHFGTMVYATKEA